MPSSARRGPSGARLGERIAIFSSVPGPMPACPRSCSASAAALSAATVVMPSSCQIRRAVFGPSPGSRMKTATSAGTSALLLRQRVDLAVLDDLDDLPLDRLADALQLLRLAVERELRDRRRGLADPRRRLR